MIRSAAGNLNSSKIELQTGALNSSWRIDRY